MSLYILLWLLSYIKNKINFLSYEWLILFFFFLENTIFKNTKSTLAF